MPGTSPSSGKSGSSSGTDVVVVAELLRERDENAPDMAMLLLPLPRSWLCRLVAGGGGGARFCCGGGVGAAAGAGTEAASSSTDMLFEGSALDLRGGRGGGGAGFAASEDEEAR